MKPGDKVYININNPEKFCKWLYDAINGKTGTIEREYPNNLLCGNFERYKWLVRFDVPVPHHAAGWPDATHQWLTDDEVLPCSPS